MVAAAKVLDGVAHERPGNLPRDQSIRSADTFARLVSPENLELFFDDQVPIEKRITGAKDYITGATYLGKLYDSACELKAVGPADVVEWNNAGFQYGLAYFQLSKAFIGAMSKDDPLYKPRLAALDQLRKAMAGSIEAGLKNLAGPKKLNADERGRLIAYMQESFPKIFPHLTRQTREDLQKALQDAAISPGLREVRPELRKLNGAISAAVENSDQADQ